MGLFSKDAMHLSTAGYWGREHLCFTLKKNSNLFFEKEEKDFLRTGCCLMNEVLLCKTEILLCFLALKVEKAAFEDSQSKGADNHSIRHDCVCRLCWQQWCAALPIMLYILLQNYSKMKH